MSAPLIFPFPIAAPTDLSTLAIKAKQVIDWHGTLFEAPFPHPGVIVSWLSDMDAISSVEAWAAVVSIWANEAVNGSMSEQTADKYAKATERFIRHAALNGHTTLDDAAADVEEWVYSAVRTPSGGITDAADGTMRLRRSAIRRLYDQARQLGMTNAAPAVDLFVSQGKKSDDWLPASDTDIERLRAVADMQRGTRGACVFALALCGASTGEIGQVSVADVDQASRSLHLPGTTRTTPRTVAIHDDWALAVISEQISALEPLPGMAMVERAQSARLIKCTRSGAAAIQSSISQSLGDLIRVTLGRHRSAFTGGNLTPSSIPAWAAVKVFEASQDIAEVARFMGFSSLDLAAQTVQMDWASATAPERVTGPGRTP